MTYSVNKALKNRLTDAIQLMKEDIETYNADKFSTWIEPAKEALKKASECVTGPVTVLKINSGWNYLHIAEQHVVRCMDAGQLAIRVATLRKEASKLSGWRKEQIENLLDNTRAGYLPAATTEMLIEALKLRDDFYNTRNHKMALHKSSVIRLTAVLGIIIILILILSFIINLTEPGKLAYQVLVAGLFGMLGASFSMANTLSSSTLDSKIPEQLLGISVTIIRLAIGATAAIIIFMLYRAGFFSGIFAEKLLNSGYAYLVFSFLAGFSERWVVKMLESVAKEPNKK